MSIVFTVTERNSAQYTATLQNAAGTAIASANIDAATLTLKDVDTGTVINSRDAQDILNANNVTIHATSGLLTWSIQPADNAIVTTGVENELHRAVFEITYNTNQQLIHEVYLIVKNIDEVP